MQAQVAIPQSFTADCMVSALAKENYLKSELSDLGFCLRVMFAGIGLRGSTMQSAPKLCGTEALVCKPAPNRWIGDGLGVNRGWAGQAEDGLGGKPRMGWDKPA